MSGKIPIALMPYIPHPEAVILSCYFNPTKSPFRERAFLEFYDTIRHCNHRIIECVIESSKNQDFLFPPGTSHIQQIKTKSLLWHKEALLNILFKELPEEYKYTSSGLSEMSFSPTTHGSLTV